MVEVHIVVQQPDGSWDHDASVLAVFAGKNAKSAAEAFRDAHTMGWHESSKRLIKIEVKEVQVR